MPMWKWSVLSVSVLLGQKWDTLAVIETAYGTMRLQLYRQTPLHRANFLKLAKEGFFDGTTFHRVVPGFVIQGGDPNSKDSDPSNDGMGGPGYTIPAEIRPELKHIRGAVGAARLGDNINPSRASNGSQFYIVVAEQGTPFLDGSYTVFGQVIEGIEVADKIVAVERDGRDRPLQNISMKVRLERHKIKALLKRYGHVYRL
ncbi:MAG: peptidylprolyl isomerase [Bacteroidia bacterium]|nr:peptidylprolyl isomerase [Bacteroidia bacterium]MCX7764243.1 peptidylprolyl isomerase [Bacteroidia bacterium]MDW8057430.1 peptidylprolyl isomerase [Bacteroidia bacterium]